MLSGEGSVQNITHTELAKVIIIKLGRATRSPDERFQIIFASEKNRNRYCNKIASKARKKQDKFYICFVGLGKVEERTMKSKCPTEIIVGAGAPQYFFKVQILKLWRKNFASEVKIVEKNC